MSDRRRRNVSDLGPPPRWLNCPRKGDLVAEKFLPFKTPLSGVYDSQVPEANRFYPSMLLASLARYKVKLGLWIDLTNTGRFYDRKEVEECGVKYLKLQCRGHGECPSVEQTQTFIQLCQNFISQNPLEVIGVHCTHGFNRTGFLIAAYLVENMSWGVEAAVQAVSVARPPGIYKGDYLLELFKRYGDMAETPPPPPRPAWCDEEDDDVDDDGNALGADDGGTDSPIHTKRRKEFNKKNPTFMEGVPGIQPITTQPKLVQIQRRCQHMCHWESSGFPGSQPVSMDNSNLQMLKHKPYKVSWKADGTRYMMLIDGENEVYFVDRDNCVFQASGLWFPRRKEPGSHIQNTLVDGEMIIDKAEGKDVPRYLIYDIVRIEVRLPGGLGRGLTDWDVAGAGGGQDGLQRTPHLHLEGDLRAPQAGHEGGPHRPQQGALWGATEGLLGPHLHRVASEREVLPEDVSRSRRPHLSTHTRPVHLRAKPQRAQVETAAPQLRGFPAQDLQGERSRPGAQTGWSTVCRRIRPAFGKYQGNQGNQGPGQQDPGVQVGQEPVGVAAGADGQVLPQQLQHGHGCPAEHQQTGDQGDPLGVHPEGAVAAPSQGAPLRRQPAHATPQDGSMNALSGRIYFASVGLRRAGIGTDLCSSKTARTN
ncbi:mRNA-capping enzyme isoform X1 [Ixodes scapularis]|uniref:mRNA-capping enzyme isoform X1 n=1 Tax=Ixodes scapularis TaxID=6945 RepID=UPI001C380E04|nr:mRNA-capping enzyme isoform X1 [Ixodes scapularis]